MSWKIKNWKLALLTLALIALFTHLGCWQLSRAKQKKILLTSFTHRTQQPPLSAKRLDENKDWRFFRAQLTGRFDNQHTFLLDNKSFHGQIGYEVYTLFYAQDLSQPILVDRGFVALTGKRQELPVIHAISGTVTLIGMLNLPPSYFALGPINETPQMTWPLRIEYIKLSELSQLMHLPHTQCFFPYVLTLAPHHPAAYPLDWEIVTIAPEKHLGYALQWFAFALTLLILFVILNRGSTKGTSL